MIWCTKFGGVLRRLIQVCLTRGLVAVCIPPHPSPSSPALRRLDVLPNSCPLWHSKLSRRTWFLVSRPPLTRKSLGSNRSVSMLSEHDKPGITNWTLRKVWLLCHDVLNSVMSTKSCFAEAPPVVQWLRRQPDTLNGASATLAKFMAHPAKI